MKSEINEGKCSDYVRFIVVAVVAVVVAVVVPACCSTRRAVKKEGFGGIGFLGLRSDFR